MLLMPVTLSSAEHRRWKEPICNRSVGDSSKDVSPCPLLLSWLCLHKCGGVYLQCQDQCWPQINNILRTCTLTADRLGYINLSHPPCFGDSALLLTPPLHFSLIVKLMAVIFSWAVVDTLFIWRCVLRLLSSHPSSPLCPSRRLLFSYHASSVRRRRGHNLGPRAWEQLCLSFPQQLISFGPRHFLGETAIKVIPITLFRCFPDSRCSFPTLSALKTV